MAANCFVISKHNLDKDGNLLGAYPLYSFKNKSDTKEKLKRLESIVRATPRKDIKEKFVVTLVPIQ